MKRIQDYQVCQMCHWSSGCNKCCRKCGKGCGQVCGLKDSMSSKISRWESWQQIKKGEAVARKAPKQKEFDNLPPPDPLAQKAIEYLNARGELETAQKNVDNAKVDLIVAFRSSTKTSIKVSGHVISYSHKESEKITAKQAP